MSEQKIKGMWRVRGLQKLPKSTAPMIGMVYEGQDKFFGRRTIGVLIEMFDQNDEAVLRTKDNKITSVDIKSLKLIAA
jgi:hypothetical protein